MTKKTPEQQTQLEAAVFRRLIAHKMYKILSL